MKIGSLVACVVFGWTLGIASHLAVADETPTFVPPDDGYDWLRLTSGEWLRGELIGVFNDEVEFDSDVLDELTIDGEDVDQFFSPRAFSLSIRGRDLIVGRVSLNGDRVTVAIGDVEQVFSRDELIAIAVSAERERDRWSGDISLGINIRQVLSQLQKNSEN